MFDCASVAIITSPSFVFFFFNDTATTEIYTLSLHDALPIYASDPFAVQDRVAAGIVRMLELELKPQERQALRAYGRSEEHTSELQSRSDLVCRLLLEKKNLRMISNPSTTEVG